MTKSLALVAICGFLVSGCLTTTSVVSREVRSDSVVNLSNVILATNLNSFMDPDLFSMFSSKLQEALRRSGVSVTYIAVPPPESIADMPDLKVEARRVGAKHVLSLYKGQGIVMQGALNERFYYTHMEIIANVTETSSEKKIWAAKFRNDLGRAMSHTEKTTDEMVSAIISELRATGMLTSTTVGPVDVTGRASVSTVEKSEVRPETIETRLRKLDELFQKKLLSEPEYQKKRKEIIDGL